MIFRGPFGEVTVPEVTLPAFVLEHADARGDRPALIDGPTGRTLSHGEVARAVRSVVGVAWPGYASDSANISENSRPSSSPTAHGK